MAFLRSGLVETTPVIDGARVWLRPLAMSDYGAWAELRALSRKHLQPWEPQWPADDLSRAAYRRRVRHYQRESREDLGYAFAILEAGPDRLIGGLSLSNVRRGVSQAATLGYWLGIPHTGKGLMTDAVRTFLSYAFGELQLHRIEAVTQPNNHPSIKVLEKNNFQREGYARRMLKINGIWTDHALYALLADDHKGRGGASA